MSIVNNPFNNFTLVVVLFILLVIVGYGLFV